MGIFIFLPRIVMNNSTRNFTNSSNTQNSSSFKDKLRKLTTGVALAGTLLMGTACENKSSTTADQQKDKIENVQIENKQSNEESSYDESEYDRAILEMENEQITRDSIKLVEEIKKLTRDSIKLAEDIKKIDADTKKIDADTKRIDADTKRIDADTKRIAKNRKKARVEMEALWASVDENVFKSSKEVQDALDEYFQWAKENWYEPIPHAKYLASLKK